MGFEGPSSDLVAWAWENMKTRIQDIDTEADKCFNEIREYVSRQCSLARKSASSWDHKELSQYLEQAVPDVLDYHRENLDGLSNDIIQNDELEGLDEKDRQQVISELVGFVEMRKETKQLEAETLLDMARNRIDEAIKTKTRRFTRTSSRNSTETLLQKEASNKPTGETIEPGSQSPSQPQAPDGFTSSGDYYQLMGRTARSGSESGGNDRRINLTDDSSPLGNRTLDFQEEYGDGEVVVETMDFYQFAAQREMSPSPLSEHQSVLEPDHSWEGEAAGEQHQSDYVDGVASDTRVQDLLNQVEDDVSRWTDELEEALKTIEDELEKNLEWLQAEEQTKCLSLRQEVAGLKSKAWEEFDAMVASLGPSPSRTRIGEFEKAMQSRLEDYCTSMQEQTADGLSSAWSEFEQEVESIEAEHQHHVDQAIVDMRESILMQQMGALLDEVSHIEDNHWRRVIREPLESFKRHFETEVSSIVSLKNRIVSAARRTVSDIHRGAQEEMLSTRTVLQATVQIRTRSLAIENEVAEERSPKMVVTSPDSTSAAGGSPAGISAETDSQFSDTNSTLERSLTFAKQQRLDALGTGYEADDDHQKHSPGLEGEMASDAESQPGGVITDGVPPHNRQRKFSDSTEMEAIKERFLNFVSEGEKPGQRHSIAATFSKGLPSEPKLSSGHVGHLAAPPLKESGSDLLQVPESQPKRVSKDSKGMRQLFSRLMLGEDFSGGNFGTSPALTLSNAITNLAAGVLGEIKSVAPLSKSAEEKWVSEMQWITAPAESIVVREPGTKVLEDGTEVEVLVNTEREDVRVRLPVLRALDWTMRELLSHFEAPEVTYRKPKQGSGDGGRKWWLNVPVVPDGGMSGAAREEWDHLFHRIDGVRTFAKDVNTQIVEEMDVPDEYKEKLPKSMKDLFEGSVEMYKAFCGSSDMPFDLGGFVTSYGGQHAIQLRSLANIMERVYVLTTLPDASSRLSTGFNPINLLSPRLREIGKMMRRSSSAGPSQSEADDVESDPVQCRKRASRILEEVHRRIAECHGGSAMQTDLEVEKIRSNKDIGRAILEAYSRVLESWSGSLSQRIREVLDVDDNAKIAQPV